MVALPSGTRARNFGSKQNRRQRSTRPNRRSIKIHRAYTVEAAARATGCARGTIRRWIKSGALPAIIDHKPHLILGGDLYDYLKRRAASGSKLQLHECYCFKCRTPRVPGMGMAEYLPLTQTTGNLRALCGTCTTVMHKAIPLAALAALAGILEVTVRQATKHITDTVNPSLDDHLGKELKTHA